jgi:hypothetical protein
MVELPFEDDPAAITDWVPITKHEPKAFGLPIIILEAVLAELFSGLDVPKRIVLVGCVDEVDYVLYRYSRLAMAEEPPWLR